MSSIDLSMTNISHLVAKTYIRNESSGRSYSFAQGLCVCSVSMVKDGIEIPDVLAMLLGAATLSILKDMDAGEKEEEELLEVTEGIIDSIIDRYMFEPCFFDDLDLSDRITNYLHRFYTQGHEPWCLETARFVYLLVISNLCRAELKREKCELIPRRKSAIEFLQKEATSALGEIGLFQTRNNPNVDLAMDILSFLERNSMTKAFSWPIFEKACLRIDRPFLNTQGG